MMCARYKATTGFERLFLVLIGALILFGLMLIGEGLYIKTKAVAGQILLERAWQHTKATKMPAKPWAWADTWPVARIEFPRLGKSQIVLANASGESLAWAPGHVAGSANPGEQGTAIFAAHRDTHFALLAKITPGDLVHLTRSDGQHLTFRVKSGSVVTWNRPNINPHPMRPQLALSTCWPFDAIKRGPLRYLVMAELVDD